MARCAVGLSLMLCFAIFALAQSSDPQALAYAAQSADATDFAACEASGKARPILFAGTATFLNSPSPRDHWEVTRHQQRFLVEIIPGGVIVYADTEMKFHGFTAIPFSDIKTIGTPRQKNDWWFVEIESNRLFETVEVYSKRKTSSSYIDVPFASRRDANQAIQVIGRMSAQPACSL